MRRYPMTLTFAISIVIIVVLALAGYTNHEVSSTKPECISAWHLFHTTDNALDLQRAIFILDKDNCGSRTP